GQLARPVARKCWVCSPAARPPASLFLSAGPPSPDGGARPHPREEPHVKKFTYPDLAAFVLRFGLAVIFLVQGGIKVAYGATTWSGATNLSPAVQALVAYGEFVCGLAFLAGFLTRLAALGILVEMAGAIYLISSQVGFVKLATRLPSFEERKEYTGFSFSP